jgi:hypothetical protein
LDGQQQPTIVLLSMHKAASSFLAGKFATATLAICPGMHVVPYHQRILEGATLAALSLPARGVLATRVYPHLFDTIIEQPEPSRGRYADKRLIMVRRDPRDAAVSGYFSAAYSHPAPPSQADQFHARRERLLQLGLLEGIRQDYAHVAIREYRQCMTFLERFPQTLDVPYELLVTDFPTWIDRVAKYLNWSSSMVSRIAPDLGKEVQAPAQVDHTRHKRRVRPGNWHEVFDDSLSRLFQDELGELLSRGGYLSESRGGALAGR